MKKTLSVLLISLFLLQSVGHIAKALEIVVSNTGSVMFYHDQILGDSATEATEKAKEQTTVESQKRREPLKIIPRNTQEKIRLKAGKNETEISIEREKAEKQSAANQAKKFETKEVTKTERINLELPAQLKEKTGVNMVREERVGERKTDIRPGAEGSAAARLLNPDEIRAERRQRNTEKLEIKSEVTENGETEFQFESRNIRAKARGAEFIIDPATNNVTVITPNGTEHVLTHLPDQAFVQFQASGLVDTDAISTGENNIELITKEDGSVVYKVTTQKPKKILGLFRRTVETEVELNDQTGTISEQEVRPSNVFSRFLNSLAR